MKRNHTTITIPLPLYKKLTVRIKNMGFSSVSNYVTFVLRELVAEDVPKPKSGAFSKDDEQKIKNRLQALGYMT